MTEALKKAKILKILSENNVAVEVALLRLYARQTTDEKANRHTSHVNGRGFNQLDAEFLTSLAVKVKNSRYADGDRLTNKQRVWARRMLPKYWRQLIEEADSRNPGWHTPHSFPVIEVADATVDECADEAAAEAAAVAEYSQDTLDEIGFHSDKYGPHL